MPKTKKQIEVDNIRNKVEQLKLFDFIKSFNLLLSFSNFTIFADYFWLIFAITLLSVSNICFIFYAKPFIL